MKIPILFQLYSRRRGPCPWIAGNNTFLDNYLINQKMNQYKLGVTLLKLR